MANAALIIGTREFIRRSKPIDDAWEMLRVHERAGSRDDARRSRALPDSSHADAMSHVRRSSSLADVRAFVAHFPAHLSWRAERESFRHEAAQYALWIPCAVVAHALGWRTLSYLFATWFVLGEAMLLYTHGRARGAKVLTALRWWHIVGAIAIAVVARGGPLGYGTFGRFVVDYVFWGVLAMACVFPMVPKTFRRDVPDMIVGLGFFGRGFTGRPSESECS